MQKKNENKKNKKVVVVAAMALLLALVGISGGETYAKYASNQTDDATATVAKWGYTVSANAKELFGQKYGVATVGKETTIDNVNGVNVVSSSTHNVVAPGTRGSMTMSVNGDAEVLSKITTTLNVRDICLKTSSTPAEDYYPLDWSLEVSAEIDGTVFSTPNLTDMNGATVNTQINDHITLLNTFFVEIAANKSVQYSLTLSWKWDFDNGNDKMDTIFGGLAHNAPAFNSDGTALWDTWDHDSNPSTPDVEKNTYVYQYGTGDLVYTDFDSVFQVAVDGSVTVSQIQDA